jgi:outer membrane protein assembly factor BamB
MNQIIAAFSLSVGLLLTGCGSSGSATPSPRTSPALVAENNITATDRVRPLADLPLKRLWDVQLNGPVHASLMSPAIPDRMYVQLEDHRLLALDRFSGSIKWTSRALPDSLTLDPTAVRTVTRTQDSREITDDRLYAIVQDMLLCLDAESGDVVWRHYLEFAAATGPAGVGARDDLRIFVGDWNNNLQTFSLLSNKMVPYRAWMHTLPGLPIAPPTVADGLVYVADQSGVVSSFTLQRDLRWRTTVGGATWASPVIARNLLLVGSDNNALVCLERFSGQELGRIYLPGPVTRMPLVFRDDPSFVFTWTDASSEAPAGLWCLEIHPDHAPRGAAANGSGMAPEQNIVRIAKRFFVPGMNRLVGSTPHHLLLMGDQAMITAIHRRTGAVAWRWDLNQGRKSDERFVHVTTYIDPIDQTRMVFLVDARHRLMAYRIFDGNDLDKIITGR